MEARIDRGLAVTPLGCGQPATYTLLYDNSRDAFGRSLALRCPHHLDTGFCGIWPHRMSVCATWFCKHSRGAKGSRFWKALQVLLLGVERSLSRLCLLELKLDARILARLFPTPDLGSPQLDRYQVDGRTDPERYAALWGEWTGREREFFEECGRYAQGLEWDDVLAMCGPEVRISARLVEEAFAALNSRDLPARLRAGGIRIQYSDPEQDMVVSYNGNDPLRLPRELMEALPYFEGKSVEEALREIEREKRLRLDPELVLKLVDFEILVPAE